MFPAMAGLPTAWFEGKAGVISARHEVEIARLRGQELIETESAKAAARQFRKPELAERALIYHAAHIVRQQENREAVLLAAADELTKNPPASEQAKEVEDDWLTTFFGSASTRSSEEFRLLFGRILAGEIKQPGTISISTIQSVGRLTQDVANIFQKACNVSTLFLGAPRPKIISDPFGDAEENSLRPFELDYLNLSGLVETGLVRHGFNEWLDLPPYYNVPKLVFDHAGQPFWLSTTDASSAPSSLRTTGPTFSRVGAELRGVVDMEVSQQYIAGLARWLKPKNIRLFRRVRTTGSEPQDEMVEPDDA